MQMNLVLIKTEKYNRYRNPGDRDSKREKYIHNKKREGRAFKEAMRQSLIKKYEEEVI